MLMLIIIYDDSIIDSIIKVKLSRVLWSVSYVNTILFLKWNDKRTVNGLQVNYIKSVLYIICKSQKN